MTRHATDGLAKRLGQPFVVLNRPGANTNLGTLAVVRSKPDGYTLLITSFGLAANPSLYRKLAFAPQTDLEPITLIANSPTVLTVPPSLPVNSLPEFITYVRARPGELNYASYGVGSSPHLVAELFQGMTGTKMVHVPYRGGGPAAVGVLTNQAQALFSSVVTVLGMVQGGTLKAIAIASAGAGQDAVRDHRRAARRERIGPGGCKRAHEDRRARRRGGGELARRVPRLHQGRDRAARPRDPRREHSSGLSTQRMRATTQNRRGWRRHRRGLHAWHLLRRGAT